MDRTLTAATLAHPGSIDPADAFELRDDLISIEWKPLTTCHLREGCLITKARSKQRGRVKVAVLRKRAEMAAWQQRRERDIKLASRALTLWSARNKQLSAAAFSCPPLTCDVAEPARADAELALGDGQFLLWRLGTLNIHWRADLIYELIVSGGTLPRDELINRTISRQRRLIPGMRWDREDRSSVWSIFMRHLHSLRRRQLVEMGFRVDLQTGEVLSDKEHIGLLAGRQPADMRLYL